MAGGQIMERPSVLADATVSAAAVALSAARADRLPRGDLPSSRSAGPSKRLILSHDVLRPRACGGGWRRVRARGCRSRLRP